ncbi:uncharacterized protein LAESUDRAFT_346985 [Laetiporus sulphureus 93-53]|uniref:Uncharacterized protein n=1 Tax=Laetiporus sulphureus 93-53 TaxID=1314785 RepID=A0A165GS28_9APHY|nr:uncharacterized protein LAESUDRAFT_346985 [Laetiporus sulphureus 93-53]KZT10730.1 hypothetical protein LAESUDRAFT_346985 [Laetiporus sulphureus 93-53]
MLHYAFVAAYLTGSVTQCSAFLCDCLFRLEFDYSPIQVNHCKGQAIHSSWYDGGVQHIIFSCACSSGDGSEGPFSTYDEPFSLTRKQTSTGCQADKILYLRKV